MLFTTIPYTDHHIKLDGVETTHGKTGYVGYLPSAASGFFIPAMQRICVQVCIHCICFVSMYAGCMVSLHGSVDMQSTILFFCIFSLM